MGSPEYLVLQIGKGGALEAFQGPGCFFLRRRCYWAEGWFGVFLWGWGVGGKTGITLAEREGFLCASPALEGGGWIVGETQINQAMQLDCSKSGLCFCFQDGSGGRSNTSSQRGPFCPHFLNVGPSRPKDAGGAMMNARLLLPALGCLPGRSFLSTPPWLANNFPPVKDGKFAQKICGLIW